MKKFNFLENLLRKKFAMSGMSGMKGLNGLRADAVNPDSQPTVNRQSRLTSVQRHYSVTSARVAREWLNGSSRLRVDYDSFTCRLRVLPLKLVTVFAILLTIGVGNAWGDGTLTITISSFGDGSTSSYTVTSWSQNTSTGTTISGSSKIIKDASNIRFKQSYIYNTTAMPGAIKSINIIKYSGSDRSVTPYVHTSSLASSRASATALSEHGIAADPGYTWSLSAAQISADNRYFYLDMTTNSAYYITSITITYATGCTNGTISYSKGSTTYTSGNTISGSHANDTKVCSTNLTLPGATFTTTGYTQDGWATTDGGDKAYNLSATNYSAEGDATLYPHWTPNNYTVTWMKNGSQYTTTSVAYGTKPTFPSNPSSCDGTSTTFIGWTKTTWTGKQNQAYVDGLTTDATKVHTSNSTMSTITASGTVYHAVFAKAGAGGSGNIQLSYTSLSLTTSYESASTKAVSDVDFYCNDIMTGNSGSDGYQKIQFKKSSTGPGYIYNSEILPGNITSIVFGSTTRDMTVNFGSSSNPDGSTETTTCTSSSLTATPTGKYKYFKIINSVDYAAYTGTITINYSDVSYSDYLTTCCTALDDINGEVSWSNPTQAVVTWDKLDDQVSAWALSWSPNTTGSSITSAIADKGSTQKTATVSGLACGTEYTFTLTPTIKSGVCTPASNPTIVSTSTKYAITLTGGGTVTGGLFAVTDGDDDITEACDEDAVSLEAVAADGYAFDNWEITYTSGGADAWDDVEDTGNADEDEIIIAMPDAAITVNAVFSCVTPTFGTNLSTTPVNYSKDASATALTVAASASGATINYQWQKSSDNSSWTDDGTNSPLNTSYAPSTSSAGTMYYRCIATNTACSTTQTSNVATIVVTVPACDYYSFHFGTRSQSDWNDDNYCFESSTDGDGNTGYYYYLPDFEIPNKQHYYVGWQGSWSTSDAKSADADFEDLVFGLLRANSCTYQALGEISSGNNVGAIGTLRIRSSYTDNNKFIDFIPDGYVLRIGSGDSWTSTALTGKTSSLTETVFESDLVTLNASTQITSKNYYVGLKTASDYVWNPTVSQSTAVTNMGVVNGKDGNGDPTWRATNLAAGDDGKNGKFRIWADNCNKNWNCHFVLHHVLTYDANGGSGAPARQSVAVDAASVQLTVSTTEPTRSGYTFLGWNESSSATSPDGDWDGGDTHTMSGDVTLYAVWAANHTLSYNYNGGDGSSCTGGTYYTGQSFTACSGAGSKTGYTFNNWLGSNSTSYTAGSSYSMPNSDLTLTAQWSANKYTISYKDQGDVTYSGSNGASLPTQHTYGVATDLVPGVKSGYRFDGWFTTSTCTGDAVTSIGATAITANTTYYAKWTRVYTVTWYVSGEEWESGVVDGNTIVPAGTQVSALPTAPTKSDCDDKKKFMGWTAAEIVGKSASAPLDIFTTQAGSPDIDDDMNFYAVFADESGGDNTLVTDVSELTAGTKVYIYAATSDVPAFTAVAKAYASGNNVRATSGSVSNNKLTPGENAGLYTIGEVTVSATKYYTFNDGTYYLRATGTSNNYLVGAAALGDDEKGLFSISISAGVFSITCKNTSVRGVMQFNKNSDTGDYTKAIFACYASADPTKYSAVQLFKKNPYTYSNYVTTCPACTAAPTFNDDPAVTDATCEGITVTATDGLASLGTGEGCNIREYGFVWGTTSTPTVASNTGKYTVSSNIDVDTEWDHEITGLSSGTQYYVRAYAQNKSGIGYSDAVSFYTKGVSSIAITTAPTKTKYIAGEIFDPTGMVVTATLPSGGTEDVTTDCTFSPDLETALSTLNTSVTVGYSPCSEDLSKTQAINVYSMTVSEGTNASYGSYEYTTGATFSVTPEDGKTYTLAVTNGTAVDNLDGTHTITNPTGNVTVTINYRAATTVKVYYKVDGNTVIEQDVTESTAATLPTASDVATALAANDLELPEGTPYTNFYGWSETEFTAQTADPTIVNSPTINATKTFYAVYSNMNKIRIDEDVITSGSYPSSEQTLTISSIGFKYHYICMQSTNLQFKKDGTQFGYLYNNSALGYIRKIEVGASGSSDDVPVYACSAANTISGSALEDEDISDYKYVYLFPENTQYFKVKGDNSYTYKVSYIDVFYCSATPYYMTTFCDDKIGAPTVTASKVSTASNKATVTLRWDAVANATGYKVKWGSISNDWEDVGTERTYVKENVSTGTTKWFVKAKYDEEDYCGAEITKGSTTVNTAYSVTYDANTTGYTGDVPAVSWYEPSLSVTVSTNELAKSRYHWDGWTPYNSSTPITVTAGAFTMPSANVTVKGQWTEVLSGDEVYITSAKDITTMSSMDIVVERATYKSGTMTISNQTGDQGGTFHAVIDGADADASDGLYALVKIEYTPNKANVMESATMTAVVGSESYNFTVYGRSLPTDFVIVAKVGGVWTALPADATTSGLQLGYSLTLDDATTPTKATLAPAAALFNYYAKSAKATTDYIRLASKENSKALWSSTSNGIKVYAAIGGGSATGNQYEWKLSTSNNTTYTLHNDAANSGGGRDLGVNGDKKWGMHASATTTELRFLPVDATAEYIAMTVTSWGETSFTFTTDDDIPSYDHVAVECNGDSYSATMIGSGPYTINIPTMDFEDYSGASLVVQWQDNENAVLAQGAVLLPIFITGDNTDFEGYDPDILSSTDVHIVNGSTLTITTSGLRVHDLSIEGGSTLNISTTGGGGAVTFGMNSLYLRGGWNDDYTEYDMPRVFINSKSTLSKTVNTVNFDISVDKRNYYPFAVPFPVTVSAVDFANTTLAGASTYGTHYVIKEYDGDNRAKNGTDDANWKIVEDGTVYGESSATLQPGRGYILTAVSVPAYGGGVIRFPMSFTGAWTTKGEQGSVTSGLTTTTKNEVSVTAYSGAAATADKRHAGWNLLGVPYMSCFASSSASHSEGSSAFITGKMELTGDPADPYDWDDDGGVYVTVPVHDFSEYLQYNIEDDDTKLLPGWCFFVQFAKSGTLTFAAAGQEDSGIDIYAPKRAANESPVVKTGIILSDGNKSDKTTLLISDKYSADEYEINADLEKMFGNGYTLATYSLSRNTRLAYNAMSTTDAKNVIPIGFRAPEDGEYTFSLNPRYAEAAVERVDLIDYQTGEVTNLMMSDYTFKTGRTQDDERFALNVVPMANMPTGVEENSQKSKVESRKLIIDDHVYIIRNGLMYDATGKRVDVINK